MGRKKSKPADGEGGETMTADQPNMFEGPASDGGGSGGEDRGEAKQAYFRRIFAENPKWLDVRSNQRVYQRWREDHPGHEDEDIPPAWRNALQNVKGDLRRKKKGRGKQTAAEEPASRPAAAAKAPAKVLLELEEKLDDCLMAARTVPGNALERVVDQLRRARNMVIKMGD